MRNVKIGQKVGLKFIEEVPAWSGAHQKYAIAARATCQVQHLLPIE